MALTPQQVTDKWASRAASATQAMTDGVNNVQTAPGALAAAKQDKMLANLMEAVNSGKWARNVSAVTLADWKAAMLSKGIQRYGAGVTSAKPKMQAFMTKLLPYQQNIKSQLASMPDLTLEDNINRAIFVIREMSKFTNQ